MGSKNNPRRASCGIEFPTVTDIKTSVQEAYNNCFDFICVPIAHPRFKREFINGPLKDCELQFTRPDLVLTSDVWSKSVVVRCSSYVDCDSEDWTLRTTGEQMLRQELQFASHLGAARALVNLNKPDNTNLARIVNSVLNQNQHNTCHMWVQVPLVCPSVQTKQYCRNFTRPDRNTWEWWNTFRCLCYHDRRMGLVLELTNELPSSEELNRWLGEPVSCVVVPTAVFLTNKNGFPVLSKAHQEVLKAFANIGAQAMISGALKHGHITHYNKYIDFMWQTMHSEDPTLGCASGCEDRLKIPLQPLMDNLDSNTYEVFEKDPIKYSEYQRAIYLALLDRVPPDQKETSTQIVMVVGAGRGPLVNASLRAAQRADRKIRVYAVEKNPNAIVTLQAHKEDEWRDKVTIVHCDMREWKAPELADILVSELLGSFGDNELSPECLDGAQKFLKDDGISIPSSYSSYLVPVHSPKVYGGVIPVHRDMLTVSDINNFETPFVVYQHAKYFVGDVQKLFTFCHPNRDQVIDNTRYKSLVFPVKIKSLVHGFAGYFDTVLYKDVILSIEPSTYSHGMFSWFPMFFPLRHPIQVKPGDNVTVNFWRLEDKKNVWYEWCLLSPEPTPIHNVNGRAYTIGLV